MKCKNVSQARANIPQPEAFQSTVTSAYQYLSNDSQKDAEWDRWRANSQRTHVQLRQGYELDINAYAQKMEQCARSLIFALEVDTEGEVHYRLHQVQFCKFRHCAVCQARRSRRNYAKFAQQLPSLLGKHVGVRWLFLTLTVPNIHISLVKEELRRMGQAWKRLLSRKEFRHVKGWVRSTEITKDLKRDDYAHPHFHVLLMVDNSYFRDKANYVTREQWRKAWRECKRDESIVSVDIRVADCYKKQRLRGANLVKSISELLKYSIKPSDLLENRPWLVEIIRQVRGMRFLAAGGLLKSIFTEKLTNAEMIHTDAEDVGADDKFEVGKVGYWWQVLQMRYIRIMAKIK